MKNFGSQEMFELCYSCAKIAWFSFQLIFAFLCAGSSIQNASEQFVWYNHHCFFLISVIIQPHKQKSSGVRSGDSKSFVSATIQNRSHVHMNFCSHNGQYCHPWKY